MSRTTLPVALTLIVAVATSALGAAGPPDDPAWQAVDTPPTPPLPLAADRARARQHARQYADDFAALSHGLGPAALREQAQHDAPQRRAAALQPHYATTHPWVQHPVAHAGYPAPAILPHARPPRPIIIHHHHPAIIRRPVIIPHRPWWRLWRWRTDRWSRW